LTPLPSTVPLSQLRHMARENPLFIVIDDVRGQTDAGH
jgi:hypothetical protein